jgi:hypothetical protein
MQILEGFGPGVSAFGLNPRLFSGIPSGCEETSEAIERKIRFFKEFV